MKKTASKKQTSQKSKGFFTIFAQKASYVTGTPWTFCGAMGMVVIWALCGPLFDFSETWQLVINTSTTIITFLMVFLVQNTQTRDTAALQIKLDELLKVNVLAHNSLLDLEELSEDDLEAKRAEYEQLATQARSAKDAKIAKKK